MIEITWRRASRCEAGTSCVEVADVRYGVLLRSSADPGNVLPLTRQQWRHFVTWLCTDDGRVTD